MFEDKTAVEEGSGLGGAKTAKPGVDTPVINTRNWRFTVSESGNGCLETFQGSATLRHIGPGRSGQEEYRLEIAKGNQAPQGWRVFTTDQGGIYLQKSPNSAECIVLGQIPPDRMGGGPAAFRPDTSAYVNEAIERFIRGTCQQNAPIFIMTQPEDTASLMGAKLTMRNVLTETYRIGGEERYGERAEAVQVDLALQAHRLGGLHAQVTVGGSTDNFQITMNRMGQVFARRSGESGPGALLFIASASDLKEADGKIDFSNCSEKFQRDLKDSLIRHVVGGPSSPIRVDRMMVSTQTSAASSIAYTAGAEAGEIVTGQQRSPSQASELLAVLRQNDRRLGKFFSDLTELVKAHPERTDLKSLADDLRQLIHIKRDGKVPAMYVVECDRLTAIAELIQKSRPSDATVQIVRNIIPDCNL